ncbi:putative ribonuclease H-like domain-containing protein [Tanacetum coccineum]
MGEDSDTPTDSHSTPIITQPSSSKPQNKKSRRKQRKDSSLTEPIPDEATNEEPISTPSCDLPQSGEDRLQLTELMSFCTKLQNHVLDLEEAKTAQAKEIASLKKRVKQLEKRRKSRTSGLKRLRKGRKIADLDDDAEVTLTDVLNGDEVFEDQRIGHLSKHVTPNKMMHQMKSKDFTVITQAVTFAATTTTTTRPKARGVVVQEPSEFKTTSSPSQASQHPQAKDKGKAIMVEPERPLKKKDQVALDEEMAKNLEAQMQGELIEEERIARQKEEEANIASIKSWDNTHAMMEADFKLAQRLQAEEQGEITIEERSRLFEELMSRRNKHFTKLRAEEIRRKPPTKAQKRNQMSTYLKNMAGYKHSQLKSKSYDEIQKLFDKEMKKVNTFVDMNSEVVKGSETRTEESSKRAGDELESDKSKKQKIDEHVKDEKDDDLEEEEMKKHMEIVQDEEEIAIDVIPLATKPPMIIEYKIVKEGQKGFYHLIRADGSSKRYSSMIRMLHGIDREDLETLWKLVKEKHGINRPIQMMNIKFRGGLLGLKDFKMILRVTTAQEGLEYLDTADSGKKKETKAYTFYRIETEEFIINPEEDDVEPGVILGRSFLRHAKVIVDFRNGIITIYPNLDSFYDDSHDDWETILASMDDSDLPQLDVTDIPIYSDEGPSLTVKKPLTQEEVSREDMEKDIYERILILQEPRPIIETLKFIELEEEAATEEVIRSYKSIKEKNGPRVFVLPICIEARFDFHALVDTGSNINVLPYHIYVKLGRDQVKPVSNKITMLDHSKAEPIGILNDVLCQTSGTSNRDAKTKYNTNLSRLLPKQIYLSCIVDWGVLNNMGCTKEIEAILEIKVYEIGGEEEIFNSEAWRRAFDINEPIYIELCHEFYATYNFDKDVTDDELMTKKLIKFRLEGRGHTLTLLEFACRLGLYHSAEISDGGFEVYFQGGLHSDENFNARGYWLSISSEEELHLSTSGLRERELEARESMICCGQFITWMAKRMNLLTDEVLDGLSALTYCRALDATTLRELIRSNGRLIAEDPAPGSVGEDVPHKKRYAGVFEFMVGHYGVPLQGVYAPPVYDEEPQQQDQE